MTQLEGFSHATPVENYSAYLSPEARDTDEELWMTLLQAGAHIRAINQAKSAGLFAAVTDFPIRSVVIIVSGDNALRAAQFIVGICGQYLHCPITLVAELPLWVGALDIVIILGDSEDDHKLFPIVELAAKRAGNTIISFPETGKLTETAKSYGSVIAPPLLFQPSLTAAYMYSFWRHISILVTFFSCIQPKIQESLGDLDEFAVQMDDVARSVALHTDRNINAAKILAENMQDRTLVFVFTSDATAALAAYVQKQLFILVELTAATSGFIPWCQRQFHRHSAQEDAIDQVFYDPYLDASARLPERAILFTAPQNQETHLSYAQSYGDIRGIIDIPERAVKLELDAMEDLLASVIIVDAAILFLRKDINSSAL